MAFLFPEHPMEFLGNGVVARTTEGIAAKDAPSGQNQPLDWSVLLDGLHSIAGASGSKAASRWCDGGNDLLVEINGNEKNPRQNLAQSMPEHRHPGKKCLEKVLHSSKNCALSG